MKKIAVIYWPKKGSVELNAIRIYEIFGDQQADLLSLRDIEPVNFDEYDYFVLGCSTVGADSWQDAWSGNQWTKLFSKLNEAKTDLSGKKIALFGLGDQILYPEHFVDEMAIIKAEIENHDGVVVGDWPTDGYEHTGSKSIIGDHFVGLALDEHNQDEQSESRIKQWVDDLAHSHFI